MMLQVRTFAVGTLLLAVITIGVALEEVEKKQDAAEDSKVCFKVLGCFSVEEPWKSLLRPIPAPMSPEEVNTRIYFYSRPQTNRRYEILLRPEVKLNGAPFDRSRPTIIIIHGFAANGNSSWMLDIKDVMIRNVDANIMLVDWGPGASLLNYFQVSGNTRVAGKEVSRLIKDLNINLDQLHLIGHSLGSHVASYAANDHKTIARITGLDPAQPAFEGFDKKVRLDETDAKFVDIIHTDARPLIPTLGLGMITKAGHVDFYMNGGFDQPGCIIPDTSKIPKITSFLDLAKIPVEVLAEIVTCPHGRAYEYFIESINNTKKGDCIFWGHQTSVATVTKTIANTLSQGFLTKLTALSPSCSRKDCTPMGLRTKLSSLRGAFVVTTNGRKPYCISEEGVPAEEDSKKSDETTPSFISKALKPILG